MTLICNDGSPIRQYRYDGDGNRVSVAEISKNEQDNCSIVTYGYNSLNQMEAMGDKKYVYTINGERRAETGKEGQEHCYEYDSLGHLRRISYKGESLQENKYNGLGYRVASQIKTNGGHNVTIGYIIDYTNEYVHVFLEKAERERKYLWQDNDLCGMPEEESYVLTDALHTPVCVTDKEGKICNSYCYNEFGISEYTKEEIPLPFGFTGYSRECVENIYHAGAREYDSTAGNFLTKDLLYYMDFEKPNTLNLYQYVQGNPLRYLDYSGHACIEERDYHADIQQISLRNLSWKGENVLGQFKREDINITGIDLLGNNNMQTLRYGCEYNPMMLENYIFSSNTNMIANWAAEMTKKALNLYAAFEANPLQTVGKAVKQIDNSVKKIGSIVKQIGSSIGAVAKNAFTTFIKNIPSTVDNELVFCVYEAWRWTAEIPSWIFPWKPEVVNAVPRKVSEQNAITNTQIFEEQKELKEIADEVEENEEKKKTLEEQIIYREGEYIENQAQWGEVKFGSGKTSMLTSGCGVIAAYNARLALGEDVSSQTLVEMISEFEEGALGEGAYGVSPGAVYGYFDERGYKVDMTCSTDSEVINSIREQSDTIIVTAYNDKDDINEMVRNVSITKNEEGKYEIHNTYLQDEEDDKYICDDNNEKGYDTVQDAIDNMGSGKAKAICVIGISSPESDE